MENLLIYQFLPNFSPEENWGNPYAMDPLYLTVLQAIRTGIDLPIVINCAADREGHAANSNHYKRPCPVSDLRVPDVSFREAIFLLEEQIEKLQIADMIELGLYPQWRMIDTGAPAPGFHFGLSDKAGRWGKLSTAYVTYEAARDYAFKNEM